MTILFLSSFIYIIPSSAPTQQTKNTKYFEYPTETWLIEKQDYFGSFLEFTFSPFEGQSGDKCIWNFSWQLKDDGPIPEIRLALANQTWLRQIYNDTEAFWFKNWGDFRSDVARLDRYPVVVEPQDRQYFLREPVSFIDLLNEDFGLFSFELKEWRLGLRLTVGFASTITYSGASDTLIYTGGAEGSEIRPWDLWNASTVNNWNVSCQTCENATKAMGLQNIQYFFNCKIQGGDGSTDTWFATEGEQIIFTKGVYRTLFLFGGYSATPKSHFRMGDLDGDGEAFNGSCLFFYESGGIHTSFIDGYNADIKFYDSYIYTDEAIGWTYGLNSNGGAIDIKRSKIDTNTNYYVSLGLNVKDCQIDGLELYRVQFIPYITPNYEWNDIYLLGDPYIHRILHPHSATMTVRNLKVTNIPSSLDFYIYNNANCTLINPDVDWTLITFEAPQNTEQWWIRYSLQVNVTDSSGTPIQNANITVYNENNEQAFSYLTWANGTHPANNLLYMKLNATGGATPYMTNKYNLTITKSDLQTYSKNFTLQDKTNWEIALLEPTGKTSAWILSATFIFGLPITIFLIILTVVIFKRKR